MSAKGISRRKLAKECGISPSAVNSWFNRSAENRCEKSIKDGKVVQRWLNNYEPVTVEGRHEPIVDEELFWKCQEVRDSKKTRTRSDQTLKNPFASIMFCSVCGKTMRRTHYDYKGERTFYYGCQTSRCETKNTFTHVVYNMVIGELRKELER